MQIHNIAEAKAKVQEQYDAELCNVVEYINAMAVLDMLEALKKIAAQFGMPM